MGKQRRSYSEEFKQEAVRVASTGDRSLSQVARELGIDRSIASAEVEKRCKAVKRRRYAGIG